MNSWTRLIRPAARRLSEVRDGENVISQYQSQGYIYSSNSSPLTLTTKRKIDTTVPVTLNHPLHLFEPKLNTCLYNIYDTHFL